MISSILELDVGDKFGATTTSGVGVISQLVSYLSILVNKIPYRLMLVSVTKKHLQRYHQDRNFVANIKRMLCSLSRQHHDVTNISLKSEFSLVTLMLDGQSGLSTTAQTFHQLLSSKSEPLFSSQKVFFLKTKVQEYYQGSLEYNSNRIHLNSVFNNSVLNREIT